MAVNYLMQFVGLSGVTVLIAAGYLGIKFPRAVYFVIGAVFGAIVLDITKGYLS